jgi:hypothetical protein
MKSFELIEEGRLNTIDMSKIKGGFTCSPIGDLKYSVTPCYAYTLCPIYTNCSDELHYAACGLWKDIQDCPQFKATALGVF